MSKNVADNVVRVDFREQSLKRSSKESSLNENKRELFSEWLNHGVVSILLDARATDVKVPLEFSAQGDLRLNFSYNFQIPDFNFNQVGVWATLSFDSGDHFCMIPWSSIYGMESKKQNQGAIWFESFPKDYDQDEVLGFSEHMCQTSKEPDHNVVNFTSEE